MNISNNILKHSLKNVYFLIGTACGGKTTMGKTISEKYGFYHFNDNWHEPNFAVWESLIDPKYQPHYAKRQQIADWEAFFNRSYEEREEKGSKQSMEYLEFAIIELVKLSQNQKVVADLCMPINLAKEFSDYHRIACLTASAEFMVRDYYDRDDHREYIECIMSLPNAEKTLAHDKECLYRGTQAVLDDVKDSGLFSIMRDENSTVDNTLMMLEKHFQL